MYENENEMDEDKRITRTLLYFKGGREASKTKGKAHFENKKEMGQEQKYCVIVQF